jgi:hypothetical protein
MPEVVSKIQKPPGYEQCVVILAVYWSAGLGIKGYRVVAGGNFSK